MADLFKPDPEDFCTFKPDDRACGHRGQQHRYLHDSTVSCYECQAQSRGKGQRGWLHRFEEQPRVPAG